MNFTTLCLSLLCLVVTISGGHARPTQSTTDSAALVWMRILSSPNTKSRNHVSATATDHNGNVYVTGSSVGEGTSADFLTVKYNALGMKEWAVRYDGPSHAYDAPIAMTIDPFGNVIVTGVSPPNDSSGIDITTVKYSPAGNQLWVTRYSIDPFRRHSPSSISTDVMGNIYIVGQFSDLNLWYPQFDIVTLKYSPTGELQWSRHFSGPDSENDVARDILVGADGGIYVLGSTTITTPPYRAVLTIKYSGTGDEEWTRMLQEDSESIDRASISMDPDGNVIAAGTSRIIKYTPQGDTLWTTAIEPGNTITELKSDAAGNLYVGGGIGSSYLTSMILWKYSPQGTFLWALPISNNGSGVFYLPTLALDAAGGIYLVGRKFEWASVDEVTIVRSDSSGQLRWQRTFPESSPRFLGNEKHIAVGDAGDLFVAGDLGSLKSTVFFLQKIRSDGAFSWAAVESGPGFTYGAVHAMDVDAGGNAYVAGIVHSALSGYDFFTAKVTPSGHVEWSTTFDGGAGTTDIAHKIVLAGSGNVYVAGTSKRLDGTTGCVMVKYNPAGQELWQVNLPGTSRWVNALHVDHWENLFVGGDRGTVKYSQNGTVLWSIDTGSTAFATDEHGNFIVAKTTGTAKYDQNGGEIWFLPYYGADAMVIGPDGSVYAAAGGTFKINNEGIMVWWRPGEGRAIHLDDSLRIYVATYHGGVLRLNSEGTVLSNVSGTMEYPSAACFDVYGNAFATGLPFDQFNPWHSRLIRVDRNGNLTTSILLAGSRSWSTAIGYSGSAGVFVGGFQNKRDHSLAPFLMKYDFMPVGVDEVEPSLPQRFALNQNYPNPFNPSTLIGYEIPQEAHVNLKVFDILGREVASLVSSTISPGRYQSHFDGAGLASGTYLYRLQTGDKMEVKRMILLR